jgi:hypothetical protein
MRGDGVTPSRQIESVIDIFDTPAVNRWPVPDGAGVRRRSPDAVDPADPVR